MNTPNLEEFVLGLRTAAEEPSAPPWHGARQYGALAVKPIAELLTAPEIETARNAKRALYDIIRYSSRPGAGAQRHEIQAQLLTLLQHPQETVRREALWMLSEIVDTQGVSGMAALLVVEGVREDARCALLRVPGKEAIAALRKAFESADEEFRYALADGLRARGVKVKGYPSRKLVPTRGTTLGTERK